MRIPPWMPPMWSCCAIRLTGRWTNGRRWARSRANAQTLFVVLSLCQKGKIQKKEKRKKEEKRQITKISTKKPLSRPTKPKGVCKPGWGACGQSDRSLVGAAGVLPEAGQGEACAGVHRWRGEAVVAFLKGGRCSRAIGLFLTWYGFLKTRTWAVVTCEKYVKGKS